MKKKEKETIKDRIIRDVRILETYLSEKKKIS